MEPYYWKAQNTKRDYNKGEDMRYTNNLPPIEPISNAEWVTIAANEFELRFSNRMLLRLHIPASKKSTPSVRIVAHTKTSYGTVRYDAPIDLQLPNDRDINTAKENALKTAISFFAEMSKNAKLIRDALKTQL